VAEGDDPLVGRRWLPAEALPEVSEIDADQLSAFGILRRSRVDSDRTPEERWGAYKTGMVGRLGLNPALSRRASTDIGDVWVIPGNGFICLDVGGGCCNPSNAARERGMVTWTSGRSKDSSIVHGLVPDGVQEVVLTAIDGTTKTMAVEDNVYGTEMDGVFTSLRFAGPNGTIALGPWR
jgi:hypothetical protein